MASAYISPLNPPAKKNKEEDEEGGAQEEEDEGGEDSCVARIQTLPAPLKGGDEEVKARHLGYAGTLQPCEPGRQQHW